MEMPKLTPISKLILISEPFLILEPILEQILERIPEPIPILEPIPEPILESIPETDSRPIIDRKTSKLARIGSDENFIFPNTSIVDCAVDEPINKQKPTSCLTIERVSYTDRIANGTACAIDCPPPAW